MEIRSFVYLDKIQPQFAAITAAQADGDIPVNSMASLWIEIQPGIEINRMLDIALKETSVKPAVLVEEREYGILEIHHKSQDEVRAAGRKIKEVCGFDLKNVIKPKIFTSQIITRVSDYQAQIINRKASGSLLIPGQSLYILEVAPACWSTIAANEAEKNVNITMVHFRFRGRFGRVHLAGSEADVHAVKDVIEDLFTDESNYLF